MTKFLTHKLAIVFPGIFLAPSFLNTVEHNMHQPFNQNQQSILKNNSKWEFDPYLSSFFADKTVNQIVKGNTSDTNQQVMYATSSGLYIQKDPETDPMLISAFSQKGVDITHDNYLSIVANRDGATPRYFVNVTTIVVGIKANRVYALNFDNPKDLTTAKLSPLNPFEPTHGDAGKLYASQVIQVANWTFGIYNQDNGKIGLVWDTHWKGTYNCARVDSFNKLNLDGGQEKYFNLVQDGYHGRLFITTANRFIEIYNILSNRTEILQQYRFFSNDKPITPTNFSNVYFYPRTRDVEVATDQGNFFISSMDLYEAERIQDPKLFVMKQNQFDGINPLTKIYGIYDDGFFGLWALTNQGLYYDNLNLTIDPNPFIKVSDGIENLDGVFSINFSATEDNKLIPYLGTSNGVYIGSLHEIKPDPTPTPTPTPKPSANTNKLSGGSIAGIVIGTLGGLGLIAATSYYFYRKNK